MTPSSGEAERRIARRRLHDGVARLALLVVSERDVQRLLERTARCLEETLGIDYAHVYELLPDGKTLVLRALANGERRAPSRLKLTRPTGSQASFTLHAGTPVISTDLRKEARFRVSPSKRALGTTMAVSVPLIGQGGRPFGVLEAGAGRPPLVPPDAIVDVLLSAGALVVAAVEAARVEAACRFLAESETRLVSAHDFEQSTFALAEMAVPRLADWCCIDVVLPNGKVDSIALAHADPDVARRARRIRARLRPDTEAETGIGRVLRSGATEFHTDLGAALSVGDDQQKALARLVEIAGFREAIVAPLVARGHVFGTVTLVSQRTRRPFSEGDVQLADAFAGQAALALDNVRLFFGKRSETSPLPRLVGVETGVALLDAERIGTRLLGTIAEEKRRLTRVVESVVLASELTAALLRPVTNECDVVQRVAAALDGVRAALPGSVVLEHEPTRVVTVSDPGAVTKIVTCLIENAALHSQPDASVRVRVEADGARVRVLVTDDGPGIAADELGRVFDKFYRGERARGADGAGLGLYISRELAGRLDGRIDIVRKGHETTAILELPLANFDPVPHDAPGGRRPATRRGSSRP